MTSALQQPRNADEQSARRFVGFPFRLQPNPQPGGQQAAQAVARLAGMTALPIPHAGHGEAMEVMQGFMSVVKEAGRLDMQTAEALEDGKLSVVERQTIAASLDALIAAAVEMRAMVRGA